MRRDYYQLPISQPRALPAAHYPQNESLWKMQPPEKRFLAGSPLPSNLACLWCDKSSHDYLRIDDWHRVWLFDRETHCLQVHRVADARFLPAPNATTEDWQRAAAFRTGEMFVERLRQYLPRAYLFFPDQWPEAKPGEVWRPGNPIGNLVNYMGRFGESYEMPPATYRAISKPRVKDLGGGPNSYLSVIDLRCESSPGCAGDFHRIGAIYRHIPTEYLEPIPNWTYGASQVPYLAVDDPDLCKMIAVSAGNALTPFEFDVWGEFLVDRGRMGDFLATFVDRKFHPGLEFPVQCFADALHALGHHCEASGPVLISDDVKAENRGA